MGFTVGLIIGLLAGIYIGAAIVIADLRKNGFKYGYITRTLNQDED